MHCARSPPLKEQPQACVHTCKTHKHTQAHTQTFFNAAARALCAESFFERAATRLRKHTQSTHTHARPQAFLNAAARALCAGSPLKGGVALSARQQRRRDRLAQIYESGGKIKSGPGLPGLGADKSPWPGAPAQAAAQVCVSGRGCGWVSGCVCVCECMRVYVAVCVCVCPSPS